MLETFLTTEGRVLWVNAALVAYLVQGPDLDGEATTKIGCAGTIAPFLVPGPVDAVAEMLNANLGILPNAVHRVAEAITPSPFKGVLRG